MGNLGCTVDGMYSTHLPDMDSCPATTQHVRIWSLFRVGPIATPLLIKPQGPPSLKLRLRLTKYHLTLRTNLDLYLTASQYIAKAGHVLG